MPFGPQGNEFGQVTYNQTGSIFIGIVYDQSGTTSYIIVGNATSFS